MDALKKMDDHLVHTTPNHHPTKMDVHPKTFLPIILTAKWFVRHSNTSPQPAATTFASSSMLIGNSICTLMSPEAATLSLFRIMLPLLVPSGRYNLGRRIKSCKVWNVRTFFYDSDMFVKIFLLLSVQFYSMWLEKSPVNNTTGLACFCN